MMKINGIEFDFDAFDADDMEIAKKEMNNVVYALKNPPKINDRIELIKYTVKTVGQCLNNILGNGAADKIFKGKTNMRLALKSFEELVSNIQKQDSEFENEIKVITDKYSPNRAARRNKSNNQQKVYHKKKKR